MASSSPLPVMSRSQDEPPTGRRQTPRHGGPATGLRGPAGLDPLVAGDAARAGLGAALLSLLTDRLAAGSTDDVAALIPAYVALPRGIGAVAAGAGWTPEIR